MTTIERDYAIIFNQRIERPERVIPGDWFSQWQAFTDPVDYQEAFEAGVESVNSEVEDLEGTIEDLRGEVRSLENEVSNLEMEIERLQIVEDTEDR